MEHGKVNFLPRQGTKTRKKKTQLLLNRRVEQEKYIFLRNKIRFCICQMDPRVACVCPSTCGHIYSLIGFGRSDSGGTAGPNTQPQRRRSGRHEADKVKSIYRTAFPSPASVNAGEGNGGRRCEPTEHRVCSCVAFVDYRGISHTNHGDPPFAPPTPLTRVPPP